MKKHEALFVGIIVLCVAIAFAVIGINLLAGGQKAADGQVDAVPKLVSTMKIFGNTVDYFDNDMAVVEFDYVMSRTVVIETIGDGKPRLLPYVEVWRQITGSAGNSIMVFKKG